jgi:hypothetical protein
MTGVRFPAGESFFFFATESRAALRPTQPPIKRSPRFFPGAKRPSREAGHSPPSRAKVNNTWSYSSTPLYISMTWYLVKHRDNFAFISNIILRCIMFWVYPEKKKVGSKLLRSPCGDRGKE